MTDRELFLAALDLPPTDRVRFLAEQCADDPARLARVAKLLAAHAAAGSFLEQPADAGPQPPAARESGETAAFDPNGTPTAAHVPTPEAGAVVAGRYKLLQQIGEGGMGTVWMADQTEPVKRRVAVKLIRVERGQSNTILSRFEAERQAIALMDHPHIAKLLDAGTTETGSPYFVMELVKGVPLNEFCDVHRLTVPERLQLFMQVCSAVQHAHQKGIIHRDLKPTNILVESHDGKPVPKVIDFGLAKATTGLQLSEHTLFTAFGSVMGTPLYMAPEQATFNAVDVDTRADVYALGVILYELLTGTTPLSREAVKRAALDEVLKLIREQEAPTPSSRLSSSESKPSVAANRQMEPAKLGRFVKGELDWIVLKALAKERDRRYETASGFARDIERFLNHEPVTAGPPSARYRFTKFVQRNRAQAIAAGVVLLALVAGIAGTTVGMVRAQDAEQVAVRAQAAEAEQRRVAESNAEKARLATAAEKAAREAAEARKAETDAVLGFFDDLFANARDRSLRDAVELALGFLDDPTFTKTPIKEEDRYFYKQPLIEASVRLELGRLLLSWNEADRARQQFERAYELRKTHLGPVNAITVDTIDDLAESYVVVGRGDMAVKLREDMLAKCRTNLGSDAPLTLACTNNLANSYVSLNRHAEALPLIDEVLAKADRPGVDPWLIPNALALRRQCCQKLGDVAGYRATVEMLEMRNPTDASDLYNVACYRAVAASLQAKAKDPDAVRLATEDANKAMAWLTRAVAAGYTNAAHMRKDADLDFLRDRADFKKLLADLEAKFPPK